MSSDQMPAPGNTKLIKFPPSRAGKDVKCPGYARGGDVEASIWLIHYLSLARDLGASRDPNAGRACGQGGGGARRLVHSYCSAHLTIFGWRFRCRWLCGLRIKLSIILDRQLPSCFEISWGRSALESQVNLVFFFVKAVLFQQTSQRANHLLKLESTQGNRNFVKKTNTFIINNRTPSLTWIADRFLETRTNWCRDAN